MRCCGCWMRRCRLGWRRESVSAEAAGDVGEPGPGFDAVGLAMSLWLTVEAEAADEFSIEATGRDAELCGRRGRRV